MYKLSTSYNWYITEKDRFLVKVFFVNRVPYTYDEIDHTLITKSMIEEANLNKKYTSEEMYNLCEYLIMELAHPLLFDLDIENPEILCD